MSAGIKIYKADGNWLELHVDADGTDELMAVAGAFNRLPVIRHDKRQDCHFASLYHYELMVAELERRGFEVCVEKRVLKAHRYLQRRIARKSLKSVLKRPVFWSDVAGVALMPYQIFAANLMLYRAKYIIADDMGLGKSCEAIATILYAFEQGHERALIVCPASIRNQWKEEIFKFTKLEEKDVCVLGLTDRRCRTGKAEMFYKSRLVCKNCERYACCMSVCGLPNNSDILRRSQLKDKSKKIVLVNYDMLSKYKDRIIAAGFDVYVLDEVSKLKNYNTKMTRAMLSISRKFKEDDIFMPMSGTLIENKIQEFYPVFTMIDDAIFGSWQNFKNHFLVTDFFNKVVGVRNETLLKDITSKFFLRRTVKEVWQDRPEIFEINRICEMSDIQAMKYRQAVHGRLEEMGGVETKINMASVASLLAYLIMMADTIETIEPLDRQQIKKGFADKYSCKIAMLKEIMLEEFSGRAILFSKFANRVIPVIVREMKRVGVDCVTITGKDAQSERTDKLKEFVSGDSRLLVCSDAMSYGMNLQFVNYIINFDLPWNPAILDQRIRRVYRMGQKNNVTVVNLVAKDTVEDYIIEKLYSKREMFNRYIGESIRPKSLLSSISVSEIVRHIDGGRS